MLAAAEQQASCSTDPVSPPSGGPGKPSRLDAIGGQPEGRTMQKVRREAKDNALRNIVQHYNPGQLWN